MAYFQVTNIDYESVTIYISPDANWKNYRVFVRRADDTTDKTYDGIWDIPEAQYLSVGPLAPGTDYYINVGLYSPASTTWLGKYGFTTLGQQYYEVKIYYHANGGIGGPTYVGMTNITSQIQVKIDSDVPSREGYTFLGWSFSDTATDASFEPDGIYYFSEGEHHLYAVWYKIPDPETGNSAVNISGSWYVPYIFNGTTWKQAAAYVFVIDANGKGEWKLCKKG